MNPIGNVVINADAPLAQTVNLSGITSGAANHDCSYAATSSDPTIIPNPTVNYSSPDAAGTLTFTPVANANGTIAITVTINDGQSQNNLVSRTFTVTVNSMNDAPTLSPISDVVVNEDTGTQTVNLSGITSGAVNENQTLLVSATSSNKGLVPDPTVSYTSPDTTAALRFTPVPNASGTATITVTVNDGQSQNNLTTRTFTVTVNPVNDPPTLNPLSNLVINEDAPPQTVNLSGITSGATNETQTLIATAISSDPTIIPNPTVNYTSPNTTGTLRLRARSQCQRDRCDHRYDQ